MTIANFLNRCFFEEYEWADKVLSQGDFKYKYQRYPFIIEVERVSDIYKVRLYLISEYKDNQEITLFVEKTYQNFIDNVELVTDLIKDTIKNIFDLMDLVELRENAKEDSNDFYQWAFVGTKQYGQFNILVNRPAYEDYYLFRLVYYPSRGDYNEITYLKSSSLDILDNISEVMVNNAVIR